MYKVNSFFQGNIFHLIFTKVLITAVVEAFFLLLVARLVVLELTVVSIFTVLALLLI